jgi:hypothetical protein
VIADGPGCRFPPTAGRTSDSHGALALLASTAAPASRNFLAGI